MSDESREGTDAPRKRLTPMDVQQQVFRRAMLRGYNEQDVDDFLDEVTQELSALLEEQRRLREQAGAGATVPLTGGQDVAEAKRMADDIVQRARDEAAEILRKARTEAAGVPGGGTSSLQPFLAQERVFLQDLSKLIQGHADTVRYMARARRQTEVSSPPPAKPAAPAEPAAAPAKPASGPAKPAAKKPEPKSRRGKKADEPPAQAGSVKELFYGEDS